MPAPDDENAGTGEEGNTRRGVAEALDRCPADWGEMGGLHAALLSVTGV